MEIDDEIKNSFRYDYKEENDSNVNLRFKTKSTRGESREILKGGNSSDETSDDSNEIKIKKLSENERLIGLYGAEIFNELAKLDSLTVFPRNYLKKHDIDSKSR